MNLVVLNTSNFRDPVSALRDIATKIESGRFGQVGCVGVVLLGDTLEVFGAGQDSEAPAVACLLHAGFMRLTSDLERHGT